MTDFQKSITKSTLIPIGLAASMIIMVFAVGTWVQSVNSDLVAIKTDVVENHSTLGSLMSDYSEVSRKQAVTDANYLMILSTLGEIKSDLKTLTK